MEVAGAVGVPNRFTSFPRVKNFDKTSTAPLSLPITGQTADEELPAHLRKNNPAGSRRNSKKKGKSPSVSSGRAERTDIYAFTQQGEEYSLHPSQSMYFPSSLSASAAPFHPLYFENRLIVPGQFTANNNNRDFTPPPYVRSWPQVQCDEQENAVPLWFPPNQAPYVPVHKPSAHTWQKLEAEIQAFEQAVDEVTLQNRPHSALLVEQVESAVRKVWAEDAVVETYGSFVAGLALPSSDIDFVVTQLPLQRATTSGVALHTNIQHLCSVFREQSWVGSVKPILTAKVPVVKVLCKGGPYKSVDITFSSSQRLSATTSNSDSQASSPSSRSTSTVVSRCVSPSRSSPSSSSPSSPRGGFVAQTTSSELDGSKLLLPPHETLPLALPPHSGVQVTELQQRYQDAIPELRPLVLVLKQLLVERGLNETYTGGLSSYCLVIMLVSFLQCTQVNSESDDSQRQFSSFESLTDENSDLPMTIEHCRGYLGKLLYEFLSFFGKRFNSSCVGIRALHPDEIGKRSQAKAYHFFPLSRPASTLVLLDPLDQENNIGKSVFGMPQVLSMFGQVADELDERLLYPLDYAVPWLYLSGVINCQL